MKITKNKLIAFAIIGVVLAVAFFWGGGHANDTPSIPTVPEEDITAQDGGDSLMSENTTTPEETIEPSAKPSEEEEKIEEGEETELKKEESETVILPATRPITQATEESAPTITDQTGEPPSVNLPESADDPIEETAAVTLQDKYLTGAVPEGMPPPVEPENVVVSDTAYTCTLSIRCDTILNNLSKLDSNKTELIPEDGVILSPVTVTFYEGESVFEVLRRETKARKIHMEFATTPIYNSAYIEGIYNLYEFDCGELSGWMYQVNGWFPNYGCSRYQLQEGDVIEWVYTCDLGRDVGDDWMAR